MALDDVSLDAREREIVGLIGPNGAGKTTLFNVVTRLYRPDAGRLRFAGRNLLRGPHISNFDWGFYKDTAITEQTRLELRFEFFNLFNHTQFNPNGMDTDISSTDFGRILQAQNPRLIQLAAKFYF